MRTSHARWLAALTVGLSPLITIPAEAQSIATLQEVIVTARKRPELFRNLPMTASVFTPQTIKSANITSARDFIAMVPNMTLVQTQNVGNAFVTIRGISQARNSEPSVAVIVDGVEETDPEEFATELYDVQQIEVLKGPQGALYGRDAIGGAIIITTAPPSDHFGGDMTVGIGNGLAERAKGTVSGPLDTSGTLKYRASLNFYNTDGYLENTYLDRKADPYRDYSGSFRLLWQPNDAFTADLRPFYDRVQTTAYYYVIPRSDEADVYTSFTTPPDANDTESPIQVNNEGLDNRDILDVPLKLDYRPGYGTYTAITDYDQTKEIDTGDAYDFRPIDTSIAYNDFFTFVPPALGGSFDESQSQFIRVRTWSEDLRFTSPSQQRFTWIAGLYFLHKERFISTGNLVDRGLGVPAVYETPLVDPSNPFATNTNVTFLADGQKSNAWAGYG
ncbi:MAG: TonB-dependent receptor, partial [Steroidobacteraceae bacterium]